MARDDDYEAHKRELRLWWTDVLLTASVALIGLSDVITGLGMAYAPTFVSSELTSLTPVCNSSSSSAGEIAASTTRVEFLVAALGAQRLPAGLLLCMLSFYRAFSYSSYLPVNMFFGGLLRFALFGGILSHIVAITATMNLDSGDDSLVFGQLATARLVLSGVAFLVSFWVYDQTPWYKAAHDGYAQPEMGARQAAKGVFDSGESDEGGKITFR